MLFAAEYGLLWDQRIMTVDHILDLTDPKVREILKIDLDTITKPNGTTSAVYDLTNAIADIARQHGFNGVKYPSSTPEITTPYVAFFKW